MRKLLKRLGCVAGWVLYENGHSGNYAVLYHLRYVPKLNSTQSQEETISHRSEERLDHCFCNVIIVPCSVSTIFVLSDDLNFLRLELNQLSFLFWLLIQAWAPLRQKTSWWSACSGLMRATVKFGEFMFARASRLEVQAKNRFYEFNFNERPNFGVKKCSSKIRFEWYIYCIDLLFVLFMREIEFGFQKQLFLFWNNF
jgi:hypothetical protein